MTDERVRLERKEWIKYGLTSGVGAAVLGITPVALLASLPLDAHITDVLTIVVYVVAVVVWAAAVATGQWLIVRRHAVKLGWWLLASTVGAAVGLGIAYGSVVAFDALFPSWGFGEIGLWAFATPATMPVLASVGQWLVLRRHVSRAGWWVLASAVGLLVLVSLGPMLLPVGVGLAIWGGIGLHRRVAARKRQRLASAAEAGDAGLDTLETDALVEMLRHTRDPEERARVLSELERRGVVEEL